MQKQNLTYLKGDCFCGESITTTLYVQNISSPIAFLCSVLGLLPSFFVSTVYYGNTCIRKFRVRDFAIFVSDP